MAEEPEINLQADSTDKVEEAISTPKDKQCDEVAVSDYSKLCNSMAEEPEINLQADSADKVLEQISPSKDKQFDDAIPDNYLCPLSKAIMIDPVLLSNGQICERSKFEKWLKSGETIFPVTKKALANTEVTPDENKRVEIREWCDENNKSDLIQYNLLTPLYIRQEYFNSLHDKLSLDNLEATKEAAKKVRKETTKWPYFWRIYDESPYAVIQVIAPLCLFIGIPGVDPQLEDDLIAILMIISAREKVKRVIAGFFNANMVLVEALQSENMETLRNAALAINQICSTFNSSRERIGNTDAMVKLAKTLVGNNCKLICKDATKALFAIFQNDDNKVKAVTQFANEGIFKKMEDFECVDTLLPLFVSLSMSDEGIEEIEKYDCKALFRVLRESRSAEDKEYAARIPVSISRKGNSKWNKMIVKEDLHNGTLLEISRSGNRNAQKMVEAIYEVLKAFMQGGL